MGVGVDVGYHGDIQLIIISLFLCLGNKVIFHE